MASIIRGSSSQWFKFSSTHKEGFFQTILISLHFHTSSVHAGKAKDISRSWRAEKERRANYAHITELLLQT